jgi:large subunit ribosomal protein L10
MNKTSYGPLVKKLLTEQIGHDFKGSQQIFVTTFSNISVNGMSALRKKLREQKTAYRVVKNTIAKRVLAEQGHDGLSELIDGQCGIAVSRGDVSAVSKAIVDFAADNTTFQVKSVFLDGKVYGAKDVQAFASLPSRHELLAKVCGGLNSPIQGLVGALSGVLRNFANVIDQIKSNKEKQN